MQSKPKSRRRAFTLIELLIVLAIISLLAAILFAVFTRVKEKGRQATCTSNLKQLALATQQYVQDNDGVYPAAVDIIPDGPAILWHGRLQTYIKYGSTYICPTLESLQVPTEKTNYTFNRFGLNLIQPTSGSIGADAGKHEAVIQFAAKTFLNTENLLLPPNGSGGFGPPDPQLGIGVLTSCGQDMKYVSVVHSGGANYSFVDGHVKWFAPLGAAQVECNSFTATG